MKKMEKKLILCNKNTVCGKVLLPNKMNNYEFNKFVNSNGQWLLVVLC